MEQRLELFLAGLFGMPEALLRVLEELILRARQDFPAGGLELGEHFLARLIHQIDLLVEILDIGLERGILDPRLAELCHRLLELRFMVARLGIALGVPRLPFRNRTGAQEPADAEASDNGG